MTRFGCPVADPAAWRRAFQRHLSARPASIAASLDPSVDVPTAWSASAEPHRRARMLTQRASMAAVCGYSSLSMAFFSNVLAMSFCASGSIQVVTNVARFRRALPSTISSSATIWAAAAADIG